MAGPTVQIIIKDELTQGEKTQVIWFINSMSDSVEGDDFWVKGRPFVYTFGPEYPEATEEYSGLELLLGWAPKDFIGLIAMCNSDEDHKLLGTLTLEASRLVGGQIAFGSNLEQFTRDPSILESDEVLEYESESIISNGVFCQWINHPDFRMVK